MAVFATFFDHILDMARQRDISVDKALEETRALGVTQVEVSAATARRHMDALTRGLAGLGMTISSLPVFFDFGRNTDIEGQAGPIFELAKDLNADRLLVIPGFTQGTPEETEIQTRNMLEGTARLGQLAEKAGLSLVMEDFDGAAAPFATSAGMLRFLDACPQLSVCFDTGNFRFMAEDELSAYEALRGKITHVHLKDRLFTPVHGDEGPEAVDGMTLYACPVGQGEIKISQVLELLKQDGYSGVYTVEHYNARDMLDCLRQSMAWLRERLD